MNLAEQIAALPDDFARAEFCLRAAEKLRAQFFAGKERTERLLLELPTPSYKIRYGRYPVPVRMKIAQQLWVASVDAKGIIADEQMLSRWASMYASCAHRLASMSSNA